MSPQARRWTLELTLVGATFLLLAILLTAPAVMQLDSAGIGQADHPLWHGDVYVSTVLESSIREGRLLRWYVTDRVNYPVGEQLSPSIVHSLNPYFSFPFYLLLRPVLAHNLVALLVLVFNGLAMYLAARALVRSRAAAFAAGVVFAFNSYTMLKLSMGSIHKSTVGFLPLFLWALHRFAQRPDPLGLAITAVALQAIYQQYPLYGLYALIMLGLYTVWDAWRRRSFGFLPWVGALLLSSVFLAYASDLLLGFSGTQKNLAFTPGLSGLAEPNGYFDILRPLGHTLAAPTSLPIGLSVVVIALAMLAAVRGRGMPRFLLAASGVFLLLAAGPYLMSGGEPVELAGHNIPLPYRLLDLMVPSTYGRALTFPLRILSVVMLGLALSVAYALAQQGASSTQRRRALVAAAFTVLYLGESAIRFPELFPIQTTPVEIPNFFEDLAQEPEGVLLQLPPARVGERELTHRYCFLAAVADKRMVNAHEASTPVLSGFPGADASPAAQRELLATLASWDVRWLVLHQAYLDGESAGRSMEDFRWLDDTCGAPVYDAQGIVVYRVPRPEPSPTDP